MQPTTYELKYCERCGALLLRRSQSGKTYCGPCQQALIHVFFPGNSAPPAHRGNGPRRRFPNIRVQLRNLSAVSQSNLLAGGLP